MDTDAMILITLGVLVGFALFLKTNIALGILSLCAGYVLADLTTDSIVSTLFRLNVDTGDLSMITLVGVGLTIIPSLLVMIRFRRSQQGRFILHIAPAVFYSLLTVLLVLLQLPIDVQQDLSDQSYVFGQIEYFRTAIVLGAVVIAIFDILVHEQKLKRKAKKGKKGD